MRFGLSEETIVKINNIFTLHPAITKVIIYGSRAKGTYKNGSDIDLMLIGSISLEELLRIHTKIDDLMIPYMMDISCFETLSNPGLIEHIEKVGQVFYETTEPIVD